MEIGTVRGQLKNFLYCIALAAGTLPGLASSHGDLAVAAIAGHAINRGTDSMASSADVPSPASRAITLAPHITELIFAAGAGDRIIATVSSSDYPRAALSIPRVGDGMNINVEKIVALKPDLDAAWLPSGAAQTLAPA
jgi:iron complex transport system substrate-binding protein/vitamin B12 transport system substrate-binding protein